MSSGYRSLRIGNVAAYLVTIIVNTLANTLPINGVTTGEVSGSYANLFTPAGYVFSIWLIIYLLMAGFTYYQYGADNGLHEKIDILFILSCLFNSAWVFLWHYRLLFLSLFAMLGLLGTLFLIYMRLDVGLARVSGDENWMVQVPFSVYFSWVTVAFIANFVAFLVGVGWDGFNQAAINLTVGLIVVTMALTLIITYIRGDLAYAAVMVWALVGILVKQMGTPMIPETAGAAIVIIIIGVALKKS